MVDFGDKEVKGQGRRRRPTQVKLVTICYYFENELTDFDANWHKWSPVREDETTNFEGQEVKGQGHMMPKLDLENWRRYHFRSLQSNRFSSRRRRDGDLRTVPYFCMKNTNNGDDQTRVRPPKIFVHQKPRCGAAAPEHIPRDCMAAGLMTALIK